MLGYWLQLYDCNNNESATVLNGLFIQEFAVTMGKKIHFWLGIED